MFGLLTLAVLSVTPACVPAVVVEGEPPVRAAALEAIAKAGVPTDDDGACASLLVRVDRAEHDRIAVEITDETGRQSKREVQSPEMIAALVESWTLVPDELMEVPEPIAAPVREEPPIELEVQPVPRPRRPSMFLLSAAAEVATADDRSVLGGTAIGACLRFRWLCIDLIGRLLYGGTVGQGAPFPTRRSELEVALGASAELDLTVVTLAARLSVGAAWLHISPQGDNTPIACAPETPCVIGKEPIPPDPFDRTRPRAHADLAAYLPMGEVVSLEVIAGATFSPLATDVRLESPFLLASLAEPRWSGRLAIGLRIGL